MATRSLTTVAENNPMYAITGTATVGAGIIFGEYFGSGMERYADERSWEMNMVSRGAAATLFLLVSGTMSDPYVSALSVLLAFGIGGGAAVEVVRNNVDI